MFLYLRDFANQITMIGLFLTGLGFALAILGEPQLAVAIVLWAMLADQLDGIVAKGTLNRDPDVAAMGKNLDGYSDLLYGAAFPAVFILTISGGEYLAAICSILVLGAGVLRLSYFSVFGMSGGTHFTGVPLSYDVPVLAALVLVTELAGVDYLFPIVAVALMVLAALHVSSIKVPAPGRAGYVAIVVFCVVASAALVTVRFS